MNRQPSWFGGASSARAGRCGFDGGAGSAEPECGEQLAATGQLGTGGGAGQRPAWTRRKEQRRRAGSALAGCRQRSWNHTPPRRRDAIGAGEPVVETSFPYANGSRRHRPTQQCAVEEQVHRYLGGRRAALGSQRSVRPIDDLVGRSLRGAVGCGQSGLNAGRCPEGVREVVAPTCRHDTRARGGKHSGTGLGEVAQMNGSYWNRA